MIRLWPPCEASGFHAHHCVVFLIDIGVSPGVVNQKEGLQDNDEICESCTVMIPAVPDNVDASGTDSQACASRPLPRKTLMPPSSSFRPSIIVRCDFSAIQEVA